MYILVQLNTVTVHSGDCERSDVTDTVRHTCYSVQTTVSLVQIDPKIKQTFCDQFGGETS